MKPIRTGLRLLRVLEVLNTMGQATNLEVARALDLSPPTTYRLLLTLVGERYASKNAATKLYRPAERVRGLSIGFDEATSVAIASVVGTSMIVHETTDARSPLAVRRVMPGRRVGLLDTASGRVFLAFCPAEQRDTLLDLLALSDDPRDADARRPQTVLRELKAVRDAGHAMSSRPGRVRPWCAVAVPVFANQRLLATLSLRYTQGAIGESRLRSDVLMRLRATAAAVGRRFEEAFVAREAMRPNRRTR
jgi:IclR family mhp operon transcriptional activator